MMTQQQFLTIKQKIDSYKYSSMKYVDYTCVEQYKIITEDENVLLLYGYNNESKANEYHWSANKPTQLLETIGKNSNALITFIPDEWVCNFERAGFVKFAEWNDYFKDSLEDIENADNPNFLPMSDCEFASNVTLSCKGQSRGFTGQTAEWICSWLKGTESSAIESNTRDNTILVHRNYKGEIVGIVCTATYAHETEKGAVAWIREVAVNPEYQRQGIARNLIIQALIYSKSHGAKRAFLAADECNKYAIKLYKSIGFIPVEDSSQIDMIRE